MLFNFKNNNLIIIILLIILLISIFCYNNMSITRETFSNSNSRYKSYFSNIQTHGNYTYVSLNPRNKDFITN